MDRELKTKDALGREWLHIYTDRGTILHYCENVLVSEVPVN